MFGLMPNFQHRIGCPKCGDPSGLAEPKYDPNGDVLRLSCLTCAASVEIVPLDRRARERRERRRAFVAGLCALWQQFVFSVRGR